MRTLIKIITVLSIVSLHAQASHPWQSSIERQQQAAQQIHHWRLQQSHENERKRQEFMRENTSIFWGAPPIRHAHQHPRQLSSESNADMAPPALTVDELRRGFESLRQMSENSSQIPLTESRVDSEVQKDDMVQLEKQVTELEAALDAIRARLGIMRETAQPVPSAPQAPIAIEHQHKIGDLYGGGIIAYLLKPGEQIGYIDWNGNAQSYTQETGGPQHGIIVAKENIGREEWGGYEIATGATGENLGRGAFNTVRIVRELGNRNSAARMCREYRGGGYDDWYLPSRDELFKLYLNMVAIKMTGGPNYWSSTENGRWFASFLAFYSDGGRMASDRSKKERYVVRPIRAF